MAEWESVVRRLAVNHGPRQAQPACAYLEVWVGLCWDDAPIPLAQASLWDSLSPAQRLFRA